VHRREYRQKLSTAELAELVANPFGTLSHLHVRRHFSASSMRLSNLLVTFGKVAKEYQL
jgi:hypothetical protein